MNDASRPEDSLFALLDVCSDPILLVEPESRRIMACNVACEEVADCAVGADAASVIPPLSEGAAAELFVAVAAGKIREADFETELPPQSGHRQVACATMRRVEYACQPAVGIVLHVEQPAGLSLARQDPLTALPDRAALMDRLTTLLTGERREDHEFTILFVDLNEFKPINDHWGHVVGDRLIAEVARRLVECVRTEDTLVRYGGDEFVALLEGAAGEQEYWPVVERMHQMLAEPFPLPDGSSISISASIGAADSNGPWRTPMELIDAADQAMYQAKRLQSADSRP